MALKDWKKKAPSLNPNWWINKKTKKDIGVWRYRISHSGKYAVMGKSGDVFETGFKTKSEALKYARDYMRKH
jgi:hypothetical protein